MSLRPGPRLGHYDVTALLGEGGMGQVWQATDTQLNRQVALKILPDAFAADPDRLARFTREAQILASLNHPNIAAIYGIEESEGTRALVLELVEGPTLADRISKGPIPLDEALPIAKQIAEALQDWFVPESLAVASVLEDAAVIASDFRIDPAGHMRMAVFATEGTGSRRLGRIVQRLCEIETYKSMSMLGFAKVREFAGQLDRIDAELNDLMAGMAGTSAMAEDTLHRLLDISVGLEALSADASYRLGATEAYQAIVAQRIGALRETRFMARQGFDEFMMRRYEPAMRTVTSSETRLNKMSARASRAAELLRTRVDVERSAQNQAILASMDKRSDLQLRLQHTVEGLSVVAISYYAVSLVGYMLYPLADRIGVSKGTLTAVAVPVVVLLVWGLLRRLRHKIK